LEKFDLDGHNLGTVINRKSVSCFQEAGAT
jgi:hypothetical protein